jgi:hypothetical protein
MHRKCSELPSVWCQAKIISVLKWGRRNMCYNYCGIRLLNIGDKVFGRITRNITENIVETLLLEIKMDL